jgi:Type III secretion basal body protein I, YscI, HrpB, PscI
MKTISSADPGNAGPQPAMQKVARIEPGAGLGQQFSAAMDKAAIQASNGTAPQSVDLVSPISSVNPPAASDGAKSAVAGEQERARRGLGLDAPHPVAPVQGDTILKGLENIRGVFDAQQARINDLASHPAANLGALASMQMEVAKFSLLCDVTSKLAGKSTQAFESLLKGQ